MKLGGQRNVPSWRPVCALCPSPGVHMQLTYDRSWGTGTRSLACGGPYLLNEAKTPNILTFYPTSWILRFEPTSSPSSLATRDPSLCSPTPSTCWPWLSPTSAVGASSAGRLDASTSSWLCEYCPQGTTTHLWCDPINLHQPLVSLQQLPEEREWA